MISVVKDNYWGLIWLPLAGIASNVVWMNLRRAKLAKAAAEQG
ncbi:hypothetical protein ACFQ0M_16315 [Kitasatospora aburaviensis]